MAEKAKSEPVHTGGTTSETLLRDLGHDPNSPRWNEFFKIYKPILERNINKENQDGLYLSSDNREDVLQDVFVSLAKNLPNFHYDRSRGSFKGYLKTIARRLVWKKRRQILDDRLVTFRGDSSNDFSSEGRASYDDLRKVRQAIRNRELRKEEQEVARTIYAVAIHLTLTGGQVRPRTQAIFRRYVLDALPAEEVARQFEVTANSVRQIKNRVLRLARKELVEARHGAPGLEDVLENLVKKASGQDANFSLPEVERT